MKRLILAAVIMIAAVTFAFAGNVHRDGAQVAMPDIFAPVKTTSVTHTKANVGYTPSSGTKVVQINPTGAVFVHLSSVTNKKDTVGFPIAANTTDTIGIATRTGVGVKVDKLIFSGASTATKTIYIREQ